MCSIIDDIEIAADWLCKDEIVGIPTETVYGLAGNMFSEQAITKIFTVKQRPTFNPLIVHIAKGESLTRLAHSIPTQAYQLAEAFWPGPLTLVLPKNPTVMPLITAHKPTVAIRMPAHDLLQNLLNRLPFPLVAPSANPFTRISPTSARQVAQYFDGQIPAVLEGGNCEKGIESTIVGFDNGRTLVYRLGAIPVESLEKVVGKVTLLNPSKQAHQAQEGLIAPGMFYKHYAPTTTAIWVDNLQGFIEAHPHKRIGVLSFQETASMTGITQEVLSATGNFNEASHRLYAALDRLDKAQLDYIITTGVPDQQLGRSINDRLARAFQRQHP